MRGLRTCTLKLLFCFPTYYEAFFNSIISRSFSSCVCVRRRRRRRRQTHESEKSLEHLIEVLIKPPKVPNRGLQDVYKPVIEAKEVCHLQPFFTSTVSTLQVTK